MLLTGFLHVLVLNPSPTTTYFKHLLQQNCIMADAGETVTPDKSGRTKSCKAWEHFTQHPYNKLVVCKICKAALAWHGSTTVMNEHLRRKHVGVTEEGITPKKQRSMSEFVHVNPQCTPAQASVLTGAVLKMLVTDMRPLSMVEEKGFQSMVSALNPSYKLPSRTHFTTLMERKYRETFQHVTDTIHHNESRIALTADIWTRVATEAYLGITCHYIGDDWKMNSICLTTKPLEERHTAAHIAGWLEEVLERFQIPPKKIIALVHDNAANMVAAENILEEKHGWSSIRCTGHTLQLFINGAMKNAGIDRAVSAARGLVEHFKKSELASTKLKEKQKQMGTAEHKLVQDVSTRWNSTYYMADRLLEQRWPVTATL
ncbi:E3 SUMO-protein ligase ZBED1-like [Bufo bufo]|uniref:E3 SUMO-protein ligase ZBED1-like n=1 Tax=Bufo bufo TaxID=8384 RepID=UPI001ABE5680|nr:E3 SUMO-protein ligase ZBED1-like [Bufo bufo]